MQANDLRRGTAIIFKNEVHVVTDVKHRTPGNKRAFVQATVKSVKAGKIIQQRFSSTEDVPVADLDSRRAQYLYQDQEGFHFMDLADYNTFAIAEPLIGNQKFYLKENDELDIDFHEGLPIQIELPAHVFLKVAEAPPWVKGDSVSNNMKPGVCETGLKLQIPIFIKEGDVIKVNTETGEYVERK